MRNALYLDDTTGKIKKARHVAFDEGMNDVDDPPPYVKYIRDPSAQPDVFDLSDHDSLSVSLSPFTNVKHYDLAFQPQDQHSLGRPYWCRKN